MKEFLVLTNNDKGNEEAGKEVSKKGRFHKGLQNIYKNFY